MTWMRLCVYLICFIPSPGFSEEITVAVAANFAPPMKAIVTAFESHTGHKVKLSFGSSGKLYAQIKNGAPFHVFLSADQTKPLALEEDGLVVRGTRFTYAIGTLVLWSANPKLIDPQASVLKQGHFSKLAVANPKLAPYGAAAIDVLNKLGIEKITRPKRVQGENIAQTYQFTRTGNAELGFVASSQIINTNQGSSWIVPIEFYRPIRQDAVLLRLGEDIPAAGALLEFLQHDQARLIIRSFAYQTQDGT